MFTRSLILNLFAVLLSTLLTEHITEAFVRGSTNVVQRTTIATNSAVTSLNAVAKKNAAAKKKKASTVKVKKEKVESVRKKEFVSKMAEELDITKADAEDSLICALELITSVSTLFLSSQLFMMRFCCCLFELTCIETKNEKLNYFVLLS